MKDARSSEARSLIGALVDESEEASRWIGRE